MSARHVLIKLSLANSPQVLAMVAQEKNLLLEQQPKATIYIKDMAKFTHVLLSMTEMTFESGWLRTQLILFCQLAAITSSRPGALLNLHY